MDKIKKMWCNLSLRKSIILYISAFVILAILLSAGTATLCNNATKTIESKYPPTGEKYYLTNENGERLGDGNYIGVAPVAMSEKDQRLLSICEVAPIIATPIYSALCIITATLLFYRNITCGTVLKYQILLAFMSAISVTGIVLILSAVCKSQMIAFVISAAIYVIPIMLPISETSALYRIIVLMPLFYSQYISIMSVEQMHNGMLYAVWSIPVAIALVVIGSIISHKAFSKHQVR